MSVVLVPLSVIAFAIGKVAYAGAVAFAFHPVAFVDVAVFIDGAPHTVGFTLDGREVPTTGLGAGIYVIKMNNRTFKTLAR